LATPPVTRDLRADERIEYQEIGEFARHDDVVNNAVSSILLPVLAAAIAFATKNPEYAVALFLASVVVWLYWAVVTMRRNDFAAIRYRRARDLETMAGLRHHVAIDNADHRQFIWSRWQRIKAIEGFLSVALFTAWLWLLLSPLMPKEVVEFGLSSGLGAVLVVAVVAAIVKAFRRRAIAADRRITEKQQRAG
jgi:hypothetical protein